MISRKLGLITLLWLGLVSLLWAGVTGKIKGRIVDAATGEGLPSVNVVLEGTMWGAATDVHGDYTIINIPPGKYTIVARMLGYKNSIIRDIPVTQDLTTTRDIKMEESSIQGEEVTIIAERSIVQRDITSSTRTATGEEINKMPVTSFVGYVANRGGTVETGGADAGIHIRGGRSGEIVYIVDGVNTNDPVTASRGVSLDNNAVAEIMVITGGFDAEYGQAMSGIVNIITKEGSRDTYTGTAEITTDAPLSGSRYGNGYDKYNFTLGGPLFWKNKITFFISGALNDYDNDPSRAGVEYRHDDYKKYTGTYKLVFNANQNLRFVFNGNLAQTKYHNFDFDRSWGSSWLNDTYLFESGNSQFNFRISHTLSPSTFYEAQVSYFNTYMDYSAQDGKHYQDWKTVTTDLAWVKWANQQKYYNEETQVWTRDMDSVWIDYYKSAKSIVSDGTEGSVYDANYGIYWANIIQMRTAYNNRWYDTGSWVYNQDSTGILYQKFDMDNYVRYLQLSRTEQMDHEDWAYVGDIDAMYTNYEHTGYFHLDFVPRWSTRSSDKYDAKFDLTSQINKANQIKFGVFYQKTTMDYKDIQFLNTNPYFDTYNYSPELMAAYLQDKIEWEDMTIKPGIRFDRIDLKAKHPVNSEDLDQGYTDTDPKYQISPRFGISFAMSDRAVMYASYGHFFQVPEYGEIYMNLNADITSGLPLLGNPDIKPEKTIAYELGFRYAVTPDIALEISSYYKNVENLLGTRQVSTFYQDRLAQYTIFKVDDFAKIKGIELSFSKRFRPGLSWDMTYSYMQAKGTGSSAREFYYDYLSTSSELPKQEYPLEFDITHSAKVNLNYYIAPKSGPRLFDHDILSDVNANLQLTANTGRPYTPQDRKGNPLEVGSKRLPSYFNIDLRVEKVIPLSQKINLSIYCDARNLLDNVNVRDVDPYTGKPDDDGNPPVKDPNNWSQYAQYGYSNWEEFYNAAVERWQELNKNPANYFAPRVIYFGAMFRF
ncbi:MAG: TonB-dependent receptor [Candidatus Delongbacteria bacterium]|nr:TonB-dependent receptor [Candidatus Delongbacteria bacterium]